MKKKSASQSAFFNPRVLIGVIFLVVVLLGLFAFDLFPGASAKAERPAQNPNVGPSHKVSVSDPELVAKLKAEGGRVIADYGSFVLLEVSDGVASSLTNNPKAENADHNNLVLLNAGTIDTQTSQAQAMRRAVSASPGKQMRLIQFAGPIRGDWHQALVATGAHIVTYIPHNTYLVYGTSADLERVHTLALNRAVAQWDAEYTAAFRLDPAVTGVNAKDGAVPENLSERGNEQFIIQLVDDPTENAVTLALIEQHKQEAIIKQETVAGYVNVTVALPRDVVLHQLAERVDVVSIQQWGTPRLNDEAQDIIISGNLTGNIPTPMNYLTYLTSKGFDVTTTAGFTVNISDDGLDNGTTTPNHFGLYRVGDPTVPANSRVTYVRRVPAGAGTIQGCGGHGTLNSHIIMGYVPTGGIFGAFPHADANGFRYGLGVAPFVKIGNSVIFTPGFTTPTFQNLESTAYADGSRISSNSWGNTAGNTYTADSQSYDRLVRDAQPDTGCVAPNCISTPGNQEYTIVFAAGNGGSGANTVRPPATAKNIITVGAAENVRAFGGADGCGSTDADADSANDIVGFSSRGPASDGRKKPDIMGPGVHVTGSVAQESIASPTGSGLGDDLACFAATSVCGGLGTDNFFPPGQQWYTASSGTSHSCPATAGTAALIRQHFVNQAMTPPSPAMTKGLIMNSARYMTGVGANDTLPSNNQGMGEIHLNNYFNIFSGAHIFHDQTVADLFTATGQQRIITGTVTDNTRPFRVTLAWTDVPGPTTGNAAVNNLDLEVTIGGNTYKGNVFTGSASTPGGVADTSNNVESVFLPAGITGNFVIKVKATNIAGDGVPGNASPLDQDYALIVGNGTEAPAAVIANGASSLAAESCAPANNVPDQGETVTVNLELSNIGTAPTANLTATLQATGGVTAPSGPQNYGILVPSGPPASRPFTFTVGALCGQIVTATLQLQDGASNLGTAVFTFQTGTLGPALMATYSIGNSNIVLPDLSTVDVPINVSDTGALADLNVKIRLNHTFTGDLIISIISPSGTTVPLSNRRGSGGDNFGSGSNDCAGVFTVFDDSAATSITAGTPPFNGSFRPETPLSALNGTSVNGTWTLRIQDAASGDTGTVFCAQLEMSRQIYACCGVATPTPGPTGTATPTPGPTGTPTPTATPGGPTPTPPPGCPPVTFPGTGVGPIPESPGGTPPVYGAPLVISFNVAGQTTALSAVSVDLTLTHSWAADLDMILTSPGGTSSLITVSRIGVTTAGSVGDSSNFNGLYNFTDSAAGPNIWTVATAAACGATCDITPGDYRTTAGGTAGQTNPPPVTSLNTTFGGLTAGQVNGTWTLTIRDGAGGDTGSVTAANLKLSGICGGPTPTPGGPTPTPGGPTPTPGGPTATPTPTPPPACTPFPFAGTGVGPIPESPGGTPPVFGAPLVISFAVAGRTAPLTSVAVDLSLTHSFVGDLDMILTSPGGTASLVTVSRIGVTSAGSFGDSSDYGGMYNFADSAAGTNIWTVATAAACGAACVVTPGDYRTTAAGATGQTNPPPVTSLNATFAGLTTAQINGTWTLTIRDGAGGDTGSVTAANLKLGQACATPTPAPTATPTASPTPPPATATPSPTGTPGPTATATPPTTATPTAPPGTPTPTPGTPAQAVNISTRMLVQTGDGAGIGGFIITGTTPKHVLLRALGPSLSRFGVPNPLANPVLELHGPSGFTTVINDNWRDTQEAAIAATGIPPTDDLESAIDATLAPGSYTGIVRGKNNTTGVGLFEVYDISQGGTSKLANISTRAFAGTAGNIVIAGFTLGSTGGDAHVVIRGIGPSLSAFGVSPVLADPTLELRDANGGLIRSNNDWQDSAAQAAEITAAGLAPTNTKEAAIAETLPPDVYTALMSGRNGTTGIGLIEVYDRNAAPGATPGPTGTPGPTATPGPTSTPGPTATPGGTATPAPTSTPAPSATPTPAPPCVENFDSVSAPALPAGWTAINGTAGMPPDNGITWVNSAVTADTAPNDPFVDDQNGVSDKYLISRNIVVSSASAQLTFRNNFNTEADVDGFWDGGVLEVSSPNINGGAFTDVTAAAVGGSFVSGGYTGELRTDAMNPLAGRMAWSGDSAGYITTVVNLGPNVNGQTIKLRWRMGTDLFASRPGWRIDSLVFTNASCQ